MYLIRRIEFDNSENELSKALTEEVVGYIKDESDAYAYIDSIEFVTYRGWDNNIYPYLTMQKINKIKI
jgi:hypothetical protein